MSSKRIGIMNIRQLLQLKLKGESNRSVSRLIGVHRNTVNEYVHLLRASGQAYEALIALSDKALWDLFPQFTTTDKNRYETLSSYFSYFRIELKKVGCTRLTLWKEYLERHPDGYQSSQFNEHLSRWLKRVEGSGKLTHKAGDKLYIDYTGKKLYYIDRSTGEQIGVEVFVAILPCSGYTYVEASPSQCRHDFIDSMNNCLNHLGGVPKSLVPDNLKSAVTKASKYEPILNKTFAGFALHYQCSINPTRSYSPQDKALVEHAVKLVYQRIFYPLNKQTFFSLQALNAALSKLLKQYNDYLFSQLKTSRRQQFEEIEKASLAPLPAQAYELRYYKILTVQKMGYVYLSDDKHYYSVPHRYLGKKVELQYTKGHIEVFYAKERIASHKRNYQPGRYSTIADHLSSTHQFYREWSPEFFQKWARRYGTDIESYITGLIEQATYPETAYKQCMGVLQLVKEYGPQRLSKACKRAVQYPRFGYGIVKDILKNKMDLEPDLFTDPDQILIPKHDNIRGADYYK